MVKKFHSYTYICTNYLPKIIIAIIKQLFGAQETPKYANQLKIQYKNIWSNITLALIMDVIGLKKKLSLNLKYENVKISVFLFTNMIGKHSFIYKNPFLEIPKFLRI